MLKCIIKEKNLKCPLQKKHCLHCGGFMHEEHKIPHQRISLKRTCFQISYLRVLRSKRSLQCGLFFHWCFLENEIKIHIKI